VPKLNPLLFAVESLRENATSPGWPLGRVGTLLSPPAERVLRASADPPVRSRVAW
jgi:hypothetical protein